jgi:AcrR family transcriptional regulator
MDTSRIPARQTSRALPDLHPAQEAEAPSPRKHDAERTKQDILKVATEEFATHGLSGARVDAIAERTRTTKRMLYYYFGSKEGLYAAVLEKAYAEIRGIESKLKLEALDPETAIRRLVEFTFEYEDNHPDFVRLISIENIHHAQYIAHSPTIQDVNARVIEILEVILLRGRKLGRFRAKVDAVDIHLMISALCFYRVSNRHTFSTIFRRDLAAPEVRQRHKRMIADTIVRYLTAG